MKNMLLHPTHRKFIRLLRNRIQAGYSIIFTRSDIDAFHSLCQIEPMTMSNRHRGIYRIVLKAVFRPIDSIDKGEKYCIVGEKIIDHMERWFLKAEMNHLGTTIKTGYVMPSIIYILKNAPRCVGVIMAKIIRVLLGYKEKEIR